MTIAIFEELSLRRFLLEKVRIFITTRRCFKLFVIDNFNLDKKF